MKQWRGIAGIVAGAAAIGWGSPARGASQDVRKELEAIYAQVAQASMAADNSAARQLLQEKTTTDFRVDAIKPKRFTLTRQMMLADIEKGPWEPNREMSFVIQRLNVHGRRAVALVEMHSVMTGKDPKYTRDPSGKPHEFVSSGRSRDTWTKTPEGWKLQRIQVLRDDTTMDGKPYTPPSPEELKPKTASPPKP